MAVGQMTSETIKSSISLAIKEFFKTVIEKTTTYPIIYKEQIVQGFEKPSFFIWTMDVSQRRIRRNVYDRDYQMNLRYHPQEDDIEKYKTLGQIGESLLECLNSIDVPITIDGITETKLPVRGTQIDYKINDNILQFFVTYTIRVKQVESQVPFMETLEVNQL